MAVKLSKLIAINNLGLVSLDARLKDKVGYTIGMEYLDNPSRGCKIINSPYSPSSDRNTSLPAEQEDSEKVDM